MPVMDGYTAALHLRQAGYQRPIVALTAHAMQGDEEKCRAAGCSGFLTKPISIDRLLATLADLIGVADEPVAASNLSGSRRIDPPNADKPFHKERPLRSTLPTEDADFRDIVERFCLRLEEKLAEMRQACTAASTIN